MIAALVVFVLLVAIVAALSLIRVRLRGSAQARGDEMGTWAGAAGVEVGPLAASAAIAGDLLDVKLRALALYAFGRRLTRAPRVPSAAAAKKIDLLAGGELLLEILAHARIEQLDVRVRCAASDPAVAGPLAAMLGAASGALAPFASIRHEMDWIAEDGELSFETSFAFSIVPARALFALVRYALRAFAARRTSTRRLAASHA